MVTLSQQYDVAELRKNEFPQSENIIYLNHASISPLPQRTHAVIHKIVDAMANNPTAFFQDTAIPLFEKYGPRIASFINAEDPLTICPVSSTSTGLNLVAQSIKWQPDDNVIFCDSEFPSNAYPWMALSRYGVKAHIVPSEYGTLTVGQLEKSVDDRTRLVAVSAIQFFTGGRADLMALGQFCHERGILFAVDAIQAIGHMPIDVQAMHIDILSTGAQKSLMAVGGSGFLYVRRNLAETLQPASIGPNATDEFEHWTSYNITPREGALRFMQGTVSLPGMVSIIENMDLFKELGLEHIDTHTTALAAQFIKDLRDRGIPIITDAEHHGPIVTFKVADSNEESERVLQFLKSNHVELPQHFDRDGQGHLRIAVHCYNNEDDRKHFLKLLDAIIED